jgi:hypothetical protein
MSSLCLGHLTVTAKMILQLICGLERDKRIVGKYCEMQDCHFCGKAVREDNLCDPRIMLWHGQKFVNNFLIKHLKKEKIRKAQLCIG